MAPKNRKYVHGTEPEEQHRLSTLNDILNHRSLVAIEVQLGDRVLDVGCGLCQLTRAIARKAGSDGVVIGVEESAEQIAEGERQAAIAGEDDMIEVRRGSALDLPLTDNEWGTFDVAHARFLLEHVNHPETVVAQMFRAVRPGGRVILEDDDHDVLRLWPEVSGFDDLWQHYMNTYRALGNDPHIGRRLVTLLRDTGAATIRNDWKFFGGCHGAPMFRELVDNFVGIIEGARDTLLTATSLDEAGLKRDLQAFVDWSRQSDAAMWYGTFWAEGVKAGSRADTTARRLRDKDTATSTHRLDKLAATRFLADSARDLNSSLKLDDVYKKIAERVRQFVDYHLFCVLLWNERTELLDFNYSLCFGEHIPLEGGFKLGQGLCGTTAQERRAFRIDNVLENEHYVRHRHPEVEIRSELTVPLVVRDRLVGVLDLESTEFGAFTEEHEELMVALSQHIAIAVDNAQLYERVLADEQRMEEELATARTIQKALLPPSVPDLAGTEIGVAYAPARELAGDFYDFLPIGDDQFAFAVGDVAGKSTPAALYGALAVGMIREQALRRIHDPSDMLRYMNRQLANHQVAERFVAMMYGVFDARSRKLSLSNSGLPYPYLLRRGVLQQFDISGVPLGLVAESTYESLNIPLESGDILAFCSDGLFDCEDPSQEPFGEKRVEEIIRSAGEKSAEAIARELILATDKHAGTDDDHTDDRTAVIIRLQ